MTRSTATVMMDSSPDPEATSRSATWAGAPRHWRRRGRAASKTARISAAIAAGSSSTATMRATKAPRSVSLAAIQAELVSTVRPVSSSRPTATISAGVPDSGDMRRQVAALARDRVSGATALARRAALLLRSAARDDGRGLGRWQQDLRALGEAVAAAQPVMGSVLTVVEIARRAAEGARTVRVGARAAAAVAELDVVVLGADAVTRTAVWNKCGSLGVALAASAARRPTLVVTTGDRLLAPSLARRLALAEAEPRAILSRPPRGVRAINRLFDATPLGLITLVVTEEGAMQPGAVKRRLARARPLAAP